jgi:nitrous oxidase accessory protein NosD
MPRPLAAALALALAHPLSVSAATLHVPADHPTIQAAVDAAGPGDVIDVAKGSYAEAVLVDGKSQLTLRGKGRPVIDGQGSATPLTIQGSEQITVDGLGFEDAPEQLVLVVDSSSVAIQRCSLESTPEDSSGIRALGSANLVIQKNAFQDLGEDGVVFEEEALLLVTDSLVAKNRFERIGDEAVDVTGSGHRVEKNRIARAGVGIELDAAASETVVEKNTVEDTEDSCIELEGSGNLASKNKLRRCGDEGLHLTGPDNRAEKNKIDAPDDDGIDVEADGNALVANKVTRAGGNGIEVADEKGVPGTATGNLFEANKISKSGGNGIQVSTGGNTFRRNKASGSFLVDLLDDSLSGTNVYEDNKFGTEQIDVP